MLTLVEPTANHLPSHAAALRRGWSPSSSRDLSAGQIAALEADPAAFIADMARREGGTAMTFDGRTVAKLPGRTLWMWDGALCGSINVRHVPGTVELPDHVSGHIGYAVVPWKWRQGIGTAALRLMRPIAAGLGLPWAIITCDVDNAGSRGVILANGGVLLRQEQQIGSEKLVFRLPL